MGIEVAQTAWVEDLPLSNLVDVVRLNSGKDLSHLRKQVLMRRIQYRCAMLHLPSAQAYLQVLQHTPEECLSLVRACQISYSRFFRNPDLWHWLASVGLPDLQRGVAADNRMVRCWSAGCAGGEEVYSLLLCLAQVDLLNQAAVVASDISVSALCRATSGFYSDKAVEPVPYGMLKTWFDKEEDGWQIRKSLRERVSYGAHDLIESQSAVPAHSLFRQFHMIMCRNVLIFYGKAVQRTMIQRLWRALLPGGLLIAGRKDGIDKGWLPGGTRLYPGIWKKP